MSDFQEFCKKILPFVQAGIAGEVVQWDAGVHGWLDVNDANPECFGFEAGTELRIKPRTIKIGDFDVPEPIRVDIGIGNKYFTPSLASVSAIGCSWLGDGRDYELLRNGLCHETSEAAEVHAKALIALTRAK